MNGFLKMLEGTDVGRAMAKSNVTFGFFNCEEHGQYRAMCVKFQDGTDHHAPCPKCEEKRRAAEEARIQMLMKDPDLVLREAMIAAQVPPRYLDWSFGNFPVQDGTLEAYQGAKDFLGSKFLDLVLLGPTGLGKTSLAVSIIRLALQRGMTARFVKEAALLDEIKSSFNNRGETSDEILARYSRYDVLVIDEVGLGEWSSFDATKISTLIDNRSSYFRKTVFLTNLDEGGYRKHFNDQCISRLHQDGDFYMMNGRDLRYEC